MMDATHKIRIYTARSWLLWVGIMFISQPECDDTSEPRPEIVIGYTALTKKRLIDKINQRVKSEMMKFKREVQRDEKENN